MIRRFPTRRLWLAAAFLPVAGCDVYDEPVAARQAAPWPALADGTTASVRPTSIEYVEGYEAAAARAAAEDKPLFVMCRAGWCRWCSEMTAKVLSDEQIVRRSRTFVCVAVDADREADVCRRLGIRGFPTVLLIAPDGRELSRHTGRMSQKSLASLLDEAHARPSETLANPAAPLRR